MNRNKKAPHEASHTWTTPPPASFSSSQLKNQVLRSEVIGRRRSALLSWNTFETVSQRRCATLGLVLQSPLPPSPPRSVAQKPRRDLQNPVGTSSPISSRRITLPPPKERSWNFIHREKKTTQTNSQQMPFLQFVLGLRATETQQGVEATVCDW